MSLIATALELTTEGDGLIDGALIPRALGLTSYRNIMFVAVSLFEILLVRQYIGCNFHLENPKAIVFVFCSVLSYQVGS